MKTEHITIEDAEKMAQITDYAWIAVEEPGSEINWADAGAFYLEGFNAGYEEGQSSPKIKKLEWKEDCLFTDIIVSEGFSLQFYEIKIIDNTLYIGDTEQSFKTIDEAKAAAQADFERRVKECLE